MSDNDTLPSKINLDSLFHKKSLFDSLKKLREAGFQIVRPTEEGRVTVFGHASVPDYLFKKFLQDSPHSYKKQLSSYESRVGGARAVKAHLDALSIRSILVPRKWLCKLPRRFRSSGKDQYIVVVEKCNLIERDETIERYRTISRDTLRDLCTIFFAFKSVDFSSKNLPFTVDGKIAYIDTGYVKRITEDLTFRRNNYKKYVDKWLLTEESRRYAKSLWDEFVDRRDLLEGPPGTK